MSKDHSKFKEQTRRAFYMLFALVAAFVAIVGIVIYLLKNPSSTTTSPEEKIVVVDSIQQIDPDKIENGIHLRTGFVEGEGLTTVINNCTNCHSAKLVTQNRMTKEQWQATIHWMQETQNLWDLGDNEEIILNYLATHYAPTKEGRRKNLQDIEWYTLK